MAGLITWHELFTDDVEAGVRFYTELLGLEIETYDAGDFQYQMLKKGEHTEAGFVAKPSETPEGTPNHWYPYIQVDDVCFAYLCDPVMRNILFNTPHAERTGHRR